MWEPGHVTEIMGPRRYRVRHEEQLWDWHQNQLRCLHGEDDNAQCVEITGATGTSPTAVDSPLVFLHHEESAEDTETTSSDSILATGESSRGTHRYRLRDR